METTLGYFPVLTQTHVFRLGTGAQQPARASGKTALTGIKEVVPFNPGSLFSGAGNQQPRQEHSLGTAANHKNSLFMVLFACQKDSSSEMSDQ